MLHIPTPRFRQQFYSGRLSSAGKDGGKKHDGRYYYREEGGEDGGDGEGNGVARWSTASAG